MKSPSLRTNTKKCFIIFFFTVTLQPFIMYQPSAPCFPSSNITKNAKAHPAPVRDEIIEQPLISV